MLIYICLCADITCCINAYISLMNELSMQSEADRRQNLVDDLVTNKNRKKNNVFLWGEGLQHYQLKLVNNTG